MARLRAGRRTLSPPKQTSQPRPSKKLGRANRIVNKRPTAPIKHKRKNLDVINDNKNMSPYRITRMVSKPVVVDNKIQTPVTKLKKGGPVMRRRKNGR